jgi:hypothetical protein
VFEKDYTDKEIGIKKRITGEGKRDSLRREKGND